MSCDQCRNRLQILETWRATVDRLHDAELRNLASRCEDCAYLAREILRAQYILSQDLFAGKALPPGVIEINSDFVTRAFDAISAQQQQGDNEKDAKIKMLEQKVLSLERQLKNFGATR